MMAMDYFAHAVFGVLLEKEDHDFLYDKLEELREEEDNEDLDDYELMDNLISSDEVQEWYKSRGFPPSANLIYTGPEDDRPGRCYTEAEQWIVGWGYQGFPEVAENIPKEFYEKCEWHDWVTAG